MAARKKTAKKKAKPRQQRTKEQRVALVAKIDALVAKGSTLGEACKTVGLNDSNYYNWTRARRSGPVSKPSKPKGTRPASKAKDSLEGVPVMFEASVLLSASKVMSQVPTHLLLAELALRTTL